MKNRISFLLTIIFFIGLATSLTIFLAIPLYYIDIDLLKIPEVANQTKDTLVSNFNILMKYLIVPFGTLDMPDFPSSKAGLKHFADVKVLFQITFLATIVTFPFYISFRNRKLYLMYRNGIKIAMFIPILIVIMGIFGGFDNIFIKFHQIFFRDTSWMFDPNTDPIINVLPEKFFMHCSIVFFALYELFFYRMLKKSDLKLREKSAS